MKFKKMHNIKLWMIMVSAVVLWTIGAGFFGDLAAKNEESYEGLKIFADVIELIEKEYVDNVESRELIEKAIQEANIGVNPNNDGDFIKLFFPPMTSEQRQEIVKQAKGMVEHAKISVRNVRKDGNDQIKKLEKDKEISEDESKKSQEQIQKITDEYVAKIDEVFKNKEADILKV